MGKSILKSCFFVFFLSVLSASATAQTLSPYQSAFRPLGLPVIGKTFLAGSDAASQSFESSKQKFLNTITSKLPESVAFTGVNLNQLDPQKLFFQFAYAPRVYYIYEGACYTNALGLTIASVSTPTSQPVSGTNYTVFPMVHSSIAPVCASGSGARSASEPLLAGDFVQLPTIAAGQQLAFFIMSNLNGNGTPSDVFFNGSSQNSDGFQHLIAFFPDNSQYIIIGFEDLWGGGDKDCNDLLFVVDVGPNNAAVWRNPANTLPK